jgi:DNA-binding CsgD family transcriptional regulator
MDRKTKTAIRLRISKLLDTKCQECPLQACESCNIYKEIRHYANMIDGTQKPKKLVTSLTSVIYIKLRNEGKSRKEIALLYNLTEKQVKGLTDIWRQRGEFDGKSIKQTKPHVEIPEKEYLKYKEQGLSDKAIAEIFNVNPKTIDNRKRKWKRNKVSVVKEEKLTKEIYLEMKAQKISDFKIAALLNVNPSVISYHKKKWSLTNAK